MASNGWAYSGKLVENILKGGFDPAKLYPVNPKYDRFGDLPCYKSLSELPEPPDLVVIALSGRRVRGVIAECVKLKVKAVLLVSAGFAEADSQGREEQESIKQLARESGLLVCGPNSLGIAVPKNNLMAHAYMNITMKPGRIGLVSQSGATAFASVVSQAVDRDIQFSNVISTGNEADLESIDFIRYLIHENDTKAIICFIEGFKEGRRFREVAEEALTVGKPILIVKVGRSDLGARQAISHTGALTGSDNVYQALFDQHGVLRLPYPDDLAETANLFAQSPPPKAPGLLVVSTSGGLCSLIADACGVQQLELPQLTEEEIQFVKSRDFLLVYGTPINPLDIRGQGAIHLPEILSCFSTDHRYGILVVAIGMDAIGPMSTHIAESLVALRSKIDKPIVVLWMGKKRDPSEEISDKDGFRVLEKAGLPLFFSPERLIRSLKEFIGYHQFRKRWLSTLEKGPKTIGRTVASARTFLAHKSGTLDEVESRRLLEFYGIASPREALVSCPSEAAQAAEKIGYPVVLKVVSPDLPHKTEAGAVCLNLKDANIVRSTAEEMLFRVERRTPRATVKGLLVQEMILGAREMIVGVSHDNQFGPVVLAGIGGVWVEVLKDISLRLPPLSRMDAKEMLRRLKGAKLLESFRGNEAVDTVAVENVILRLGDLAQELEDMVLELDINPLLVTGSRAYAADALVRLKSE
jgi:acetyltransferase